MTQTSLYVETIQVSNRRAQQEILELCCGVPEVTALGSSHGHRHFVVIESSDLFWQSATELLIAEVDPDAHLVTTPSESPTSDDISEVSAAVLRARRLSS